MNTITKAELIKTKIKIEQNPFLCKKERNNLLKFYEEKIKGLAPEVRQIDDRSVIINGKSIFLDMNGNWVCQHGKLTHIESKALWDKMKNKRN